MRLGIRSIVSGYLHPAMALLSDGGFEVPRSGLQARALLDETVLLNDDEIACLAARGTIYLTRRNDGRFGAIIADNIDLAITRADIRNGQETVIGLMDKGFLPHLRTLSTDDRISLSRRVAMEPQNLLS